VRNAEKIRWAIGTVHGLAFCRMMQGIVPATKLKLVPGIIYEQWCKMPREIIVTLMYVLEYMEETHCDIKWDWIQRTEPRTSPFTCCPVVKYRGLDFQIIHLNI
jgi:hypothetical protein